MGCVWFGAEETDNRQFAERGQPLWPAYVQRNAERLNYVKDIAGLPEPPAAWLPTVLRRMLSSWRKAWQKEFGAEAVAVAGPTSAYGAWYAQLTSAEATKESAAAFLASHLNVPREQTVAIGDHVNDVGLLQWAGLGICMGDGHAEALLAADEVTGSLAEEGAAVALERLDCN